MEWSYKHSNKFGRNVCGPLVLGFGWCYKRPIYSNKSKTNKQTNKQQNKKVQVGKIKSPLSGDQNVVELALETIDFLSIVWDLLLRNGPPRCIVRKKLVLFIYNWSVCLVLASTRASSKNCESMYSSS
eukprot:GHVU01070564.1.p1 GENE.GHVU01070564.1~~GHVU01070564.1.p1  ORF type:complete len:128 (+),score=0.87 GHVU01070564.1:1038-1421(+)